MSPSRYGHPYEPPELDRISWKIIEELQQDGRLSWAELGRRVGLTTPAVAERVYRLEKLGIIRGFHADIDLERLGMPIQIFVRLSMAGPEQLVRSFQLQVVKWEEVLECHRVTGSDSFILRARVVSVEHLERLLDKLGHFGSTSTATVLSSPVQQRVITQKIIDEFLAGD
ncbi:MAG: Lrp/AsnC family transcriptional regulator [Terracidiphilus sp.]|jgi:Lrp/AsnC family transcriptional regulator, leucine-responsive regulatory protein|nr:Lrp/AsnC family transcriptional regulator [Terracidiphilus sp.]